MIAKKKKRERFDCCYLKGFQLNNGEIFLCNIPAKMEGMKRSYSREEHSGKRKRPLCCKGAIVRKRLGFTIFKRSRGKQRMGWLQMNGRGE